MASKSVMSFTIFKNEKNGRVTMSMRPKLGKYGVESIKVTLNDGKEVELSDNSVFFLNDPTERIHYLLESGKISEDQAETRLNAIKKGCVSKEVVLKVD